MVISAVPPATASAASGIRRGTEAMDAAAADIATATTPDLQAPPPSGSPDLGEALPSLLLARRGVQAQTATLRAVQAAYENLAGLGAA